MLTRVGIGTGPNGPINQMQGEFAGMKVIVDKNALEATDERLFPKSKHRSKRVRKKLIKRFGGEFVKVPCVLRYGNTLVFHPIRYEEFKKKVWE